MIILAEALYIHILTLRIHILLQLGSLSANIGGHEKKMQHFPKSKSGLNRTIIQG